MENDSQWREVVWGLKSLPESGRKVAGKHHNRGWLLLSLGGHGVERRRRKEEERSLEICFSLGEITWCKMT